MKIKCPRCGLPGYLVEESRELKTKTQVYYVVVHKVKVNNKWTTKKCTIGSDGYIYVTKTHTFPALGISLFFTSIKDPVKHADLIVMSVRELAKRIRTQSPEQYQQDALIEKIENAIRELEEIRNTLKRSMS